MLNPGQTLALTIEKPAAGGRMIARADRQVVLVAGAIPGELVTARVERVGRGVAYAEVISVEQPSTDRRPVGGDPLCGGCLYSHITLQPSTAVKALVIEDAFTRIGHRASPEWRWRLPARTRKATGCAPACTCAEGRSVLSRRLPRSVRRQGHAPAQIGHLRYPRSTGGRSAFARHGGSPRGRGVREHRCVAAGRPPRDTHPGEPGCAERARYVGRTERPDRISAARAWPARSGRIRIAVCGGRARGRRPGSRSAPARPRVLPGQTGSCRHPSSSTSSITLQTAIASSISMPEQACLRSPPRCFGGRR